MTLRCALLPYTIAALVLTTIHLCFLLSLNEGHVHSCVPYWSDCVSISKSGRYGSAYFVFKGGMIPACVLLAQFWWLTQGWLTAHNSPKRWLGVVGLIASLALLLYTLSLGHSGDHFRTLRRFGVVLFLGLSFINFAALAQALKTITTRPQLAQAGRTLARACAVILGIALFSLLLDALMGDDYDRLENAFEWWLIVLLIGLLIYTGRLWQQQSFTLTIGR
ncbi:hypothetical protein FHR99_000020 [Litorivivens lipolytica]|uniref:Frag1/DRAM/Sfk1 family protein n=1 Tax=Litorivivens lipolytica TaxID=1524264 RepID=A0A7W4Z3T4_9GAMM|nr:hypothetical protein [Litorivivens lipolytica]MBB3045784.1 hypothetical protein [Litorivivens lipolytica]